MVRLSVRTVRMSGHVEEERQFEKNCGATRWVQTENWPRQSVKRQSKHIQHRVNRHQLHTIYDGPAQNANGTKNRNTKMQGRFSAQRCADNTRQAVLGVHTELKGTMGILDQLFAAPPRQGNQNKLARPKCLWKARTHSMLAVKCK